MTAVSLHRDLGKVQLPTADEHPRHKGLRRTVFLLLAILGWPTMVTAWFMAMVSENVRIGNAADLIRVSVRHHWIGSHLLPPPVSHTPVIR